MGYGTIKETYEAICEKRERGGTVKKRNPVRYHLIWLLVWLTALTLSVVLLVGVGETVTAGQLLCALVAAAQVIYCAIRLAGAYRAEKR